MVSRKSKAGTRERRLEEREGRKSEKVTGSGDVIARRSNRCQQKKIEKETSTKNNDKKKKHRRAKQRTGEVIGGTTHIIPITLTKLHSRRPPLNPRAIHQHMNLTSHRLQSLVEKTSDAGDVANVAFHDLREPLALVT